MTTRPVTYSGPPIHRAKQVHSPARESMGTAYGAQPARTERLRGFSTALHPPCLPGRTRRPGGPLRVGQLAGRNPAGQSCRSVVFDDPGSV